MHPEPPSPVTLSRRSVLRLLGAAPLAAGGVLATLDSALASGPPSQDLAADIQEIVDGPEFQGCPDGDWVVFAQFMDMPVASPAALMQAAGGVAEAMGEVATAVYTSR